VPVIFIYLRAVCPCDVTTFLDLTSFRLLVGSGRVGSPGQKPSGRVGSRIKHPDPVPSLLPGPKIATTITVAKGLGVSDHNSIDLLSSHLVRISTKV